MNFYLIKKGNTYSYCKQVSGKGKSKELSIGYTKHLYLATIYNNFNQAHADNSNHNINGEVITVDQDYMKRIYEGIGCELSIDLAVLDTILIDFEDRHHIFTKVDKTIDKRVKEMRSLLKENYDWFNRYEQLDENLTYDVLDEKKRMINLISKIPYTKLKKINAYLEREIK